jgi:hypothetical protein
LGPERFPGEIDEFGTYFSEDNQPKYQDLLQRFSKHPDKFVAHRAKMRIK